MDEISILKKNLVKEIKARKEAESALNGKELEITYLKERIKKLEQNKVIQKSNSNKSSHIFTAIIKGDGVPAILEDENRKIVLVNQKYCDLFQVPYPFKDLIGQSYVEYQDKEKDFLIDPQSFIKKTECLLDTKIISLTEELAFINGTFFKRKFLPVFNDDKFNGVLWIFENITEVVEKNKEIETLSRISEESPNPIVRLSKTGELMYNNEASTLLVSRLFLNNDNSTNNIINQILAEVTTSQSIIKKEIEVDNNFYELTISPAADDSYINIYATNITDQKNAEEKIQILKELINQSPDPIFINDEAGNFIFVNNSYSQNFGLDPNDLDKANITDKSHAFCSSSWENEIQEIKKKGKLLTEEEVQNQDGSSSFFELSIKYTRINSKGYIISLARDISERYMSSKKLQKQKEFYETILSNIPTGIAVFNTNFEYLYLNPKAIKNDELRNWMVGKTDFDYCNYKNIENSIAKKRQEMYARAINEKMEIEWEEKFPNPEGGYTYELRKAKSVSNHSSAEILIGYGINITELKRIQEKLEKSEEQYRLIIEASNDGIWDWNIETGHLYLSPQWKKILGYQDHELENHISTRYNLMHPDDKAIEADVLKDHLNFKKPYNHKLRYFHKDGSIRYISCRGCVIRNKSGKAIRMVGSITDLTESQKAEEHLRASEEKLNSIFNNSINAIFLVNYDTLQIIDCNQRAVEIFEADKKEDLLNIKGASFHRDPVAPSLSADMRAELIAKGEITREFIYKTKKGKEIVGYYRSKVMHANSQKYVLVSITDITEKKKIELELIEAKQAAEESIKAKELFLANMSHEIRTPLNGILGFMDLLSKTTLTPDQQYFVNIITKSADNLLIIINDILDIAKIESGKLTLERIPFNILETTNNAIISLSYKAKEKGLLIKTNYHSNLYPHVVGDPYRLTQIILNLLNNAIKFTEQGEITITSKQMRETQNDIVFQFSIADTGIGISVDKLESIFDSFTQAYSDTTRKYGGTGLGLTICKNLIQMQGGKIWVESKLNKGSIFHFTITYAKGNATSQSQNPISELDVITKAPVKVLIAEDNEVNQLLAKCILTDWGFETEIANNGKEAVKLFEENEFDIILMDIQMPFMSGLEATEVIRGNSDKRKANTPIIALTANALVGESEKYLEAGMNEYLSKPFKRKELLEVICRCLPEKLVIQANAKNPTPVMNLEYLEKSFNYNHAIIKQIIQKFIETTPDNLNTLKKNVHEKNYKSIQETSHKLKATIDAFGITELQNAIRELESLASNNGSFENIKSLAKHTTLTLEKLIKLLIEKSTTEKT